MRDVFAVDENLLAIFGLGDGLRPAEIVVCLVLRVSERTGDEACKLFGGSLLLADGVGVVGAIDDVVDDTERGDMDHLVAGLGEIDDWLFEIVFEEDSVCEGAHRVVRRFIEDLAYGMAVRLRDGDDGRKQGENEQEGRMIFHGVMVGRMGKLERTNDVKLLI